MQDPTHDEMLKTLEPFGEEPTELSDGSECFADCEVAIYWFANDWHGGQWTNLYSALSTSIYKPSPFGTLDGEGEQVAMMYAELETTYCEKEPKR